MVRSLNPKVTTVSNSACFYSCDFVKKGEEEEEDRKKDCVEEDGCLRTVLNDE